jgi:serine/threonine-protein kinase HipA
MTTVAEVRLWGTSIGAVSLPDAREAGSEVALFQYDPGFLASGIEVAPLTMPLGPAIYSFPTLSTITFRGLPGLLADALPDRFGNALIDAWLAQQGRTPASFNAIERLCYVGSRGMGALEFRPATGPQSTSARPVHVDALVRLASEVLSGRNALTASFDESDREKAMREILSVGTSAGGARAKAVIAWNPTTNEVRSGQVDAGRGFEQWLIKFDGVAGNRDKELDEPQGFGAIEYAYAQMARAAGVTMSECRLLEENGRRHFMTRRFDRVPLAGGGAGKLHMQSLGALAHYDFNVAGAHSYEQAILVMRRLGLGMDAIEEAFRRMTFNIVARNQDDHVKNIAFLMDRSGRWSLSPAFDVTYSYNPGGAWTSQHQMSANAKRDGFTVEDLKAVAAVGSMRRGRAEAILGEVTTAVRRWSEFAESAGIAPSWRDRIGSNHRLAIPAR